MAVEVHVPARSQLLQPASQFGFPRSAAEYVEFHIGSANGCRQLGEVRMHFGRIHQAQITHADAPVSTRYKALQS